jgi:hypothetical protein
MLTEWEQHQLASFAKEVCDYRNRNIAAELEKVGFDLEENGVHFQRLVMRVDSNHVETTQSILRVEKVSQGWVILVPDPTSTQQWNNLEQGDIALYQLFDKIKLDKQHLFWG